MSPCILLDWHGRFRFALHEHASKIGEMAKMRLNSRNARFLWTTETLRCWHDLHDLLYSASKTENNALEYKANK